jgi:Zn finger protein HypA/HybF involved in hydrogenase expression
MRACPKGWHLARTVSEAIRILSTMAVDEVSLDHDIATYCPHCQSTYFSGETFMPVAQYIAAIQQLQAALLIGKSFSQSGTDISDKFPKPPEAIRIHTSNYAMGHVMADLLGVKDYYPVDYDPKDYSEDGVVESLQWWCHKCAKSVTAVRHLWAVTCGECQALLMDFTEVKGKVP